MTGRKFSFLIILSALLLVPAAWAQVTTGSIAGSVTTQADGSALPGVTIEAVHVPTGTTYTSVTGANGRFLIPNVRVGGPYKVTASLSGFQTAEVGGVQVTLGGTAEVPIAMHVAAVSQTISVTATADVINPNKAGSTSEVSTEEITSLPTVNRSLQDFARTNPYFSVDPSSADGTFMTVAGRNNRYNNIQIDGAVDNDLFGLGSAGTPGATSGTQPIALDAIQELQLVVSPYDVRQGGFTGGAINLVTRSGSNDFEGSVFYDKRDAQYVGDGPFNSPITDFSQKQYGGRFGGPIIKDKLFFFLSGEKNDRSQPNGWSADGSTPQQYSGNVDVAALSQFLASTYNYDTGGLGDIPETTINKLGLAKFDWNVNASNNLTLRYNYVDASMDHVSNRSASRFRFPNSIYVQSSTTNSFVGQFNSVLNSSMFNEARVGYESIDDPRSSPGQPFPTIEIGGSGPRNGAALAGSEEFSAANRIQQNVLELTNDFTWIHGNHTFLFGTHNEFFNFKNLFLADANGYYYFPDLAAFEAGTPSLYQITFATGSDPRRPSQFKVNQLGFYAGDTWRMNDNLTLIYGLRADIPDFPDTPTNNPVVSGALPGYSTASKPSSNPVWSPRIGFNYTPSTATRQQFRGGIGVFAGRTPYVWIMNSYANTGVEQQSLVCDASRGCTTAFYPDPNNQPKNFAASGGSISPDLIDPGFKFPQVLRTTLGYDRELPWGIRGTVEAVYSKTLEDVFYYNVNKVQTGTSSLDGRPTYSNVSSAIYSAPYLTNTTKGDELTATLQFVKPFSHGFTASASYAYQDAKSAFDATSSRAISNWQYMPTRGDIYTPELATSMFQVKDRFNVALSYNFKTGMFNHTVGLYYNAQAGYPYSVLMGTAYGVRDLNHDGYYTNDLMYVPSSADQIILQNSAGVVEDYSVLATFLQSIGVNPTAGTILKRDSSIAPWSHKLDFHYQIGIPFRGVTSAVTLDILNLMNMFDSSYGVVRYVNYQTYTPIRYYGTDSATGKPIYREAFNGALTPGKQFSTADTASRWQARLALRFTF